MVTEGYQKIHSPNSALTAERMKNPADFTRFSSHHCLKSDGGCMQRTGSARKPRLECFHIFLHVAHLKENGATFYETVGITLTEPKMFLNGFNTAQSSS